jgi:hypothetical protein
MDTPTTHPGPARSQYHGLAGWSLHPLPRLFYHLFTRMVTRFGPTLSNSRIGSFIFQNIYQATGQGIPLVIPPDPTRYIGVLKGQTTSPSFHLNLQRHSPYLVTRHITDIGMHPPFSWSTTTWLSRSNAKHRSAGRGLNVTHDVTYSNILCCWMFLTSSQFTRNTVEIGLVSNTPVPHFFI